MKNWKFKLNDNVINLKDGNNSVYVVGNTGSGKDVAVEALFKNANREINYVHVFEAFRHIDVGCTIGIQEDSMDTFTRMIALEDFIINNPDDTHGNRCVRILYRWRYQGFTILYCIEEY